MNFAAQKEEKILKVCRGKVQVRSRKSGNGAALNFKRAALELKREQGTAFELLGGLVSHLEFWTTPTSFEDTVNTFSGMEFSKKIFFFLKFLRTPYLETITGCVPPKQRVSHKRREGSRNQGQQEKTDTPRWW